MRKCQLSFERLLPFFLFLFFPLGWGGGERNDLLLDRGLLSSHRKDFCYMPKASVSTFIQWIQDFSWQNYLNTVLFLAKGLHMWQWTDIFHGEFAEQKK